MQKSLKDLTTGEKKDAKYLTISFVYIDHKLY